MLGCLKLLCHRILIHLQMFTLHLRCHSLELYCPCVLLFFLVSHSLFFLPKFEAFKESSVPMSYLGQYAFGLQCGVDRLLYFFGTLPFAFSYTPMLLMFFLVLQLCFAFHTLYCRLHVFFINCVWWQHRIPWMRVRKNFWCTHHTIFPTTYILNGFF